MRCLDDEELDMLSEHFLDLNASTRLRKMTIMGNEYSAEPWLRLGRICKERGIEVLPCPLWWR